MNIDICIIVTNGNNVMAMPPITFPASLCAAAPHLNRRYTGTAAVYAFFQIINSHIFAGFEFKAVFFGNPH